ncbi:hypothetical protein AiwAL_14525 [Acidiphilium sp. AL]|uniref:Uncharacterized protein n=1 Tax=Acidiphilium iwatense TaxID=768198 RepID=A0ABS9E0G8_9PROT|nr:MULTISPECIES: hypothetical protein [Acidiphilium]MCF3948512.1 hypothetical protein [Acidiphilium iwatense]MCU4161301.1 hypothetical protein [Acidiphilium sp. AL]
MAVTSFDVDERTANAILELRGTFGVKTNAAVIRKALALAQVVSREATEDHTITVTGKSEPIRISLDR